VLARSDDSHDELSRAAHYSSNSLSIWSMHVVYKNLKLDGFRTIGLNAGKQDQTAQPAEPVGPSSMFTPTD